MHIMSQEHSSTNLSNGSLSPSRTSLHYDYEYKQRLNSIQLDKTIYESAPVARNTIENNRVKIVNYRGTKLTSFTVDGRSLLCLPQAFDFFLKNLVGGLHTVYTKLKRLEIIPIVCNVEQVRILRSLGAIQPGVNRCKLLAPNEFDILYEDCTNSGSRPGRPPKRNSAFQTQDHSEEKRLKFASNLFFRSFYDFKHPLPSPTHPLIHGNHLSLFNSSAFTPTLSHSTPSHQSRSFTIDAMLNNNRDRLTKPIDLPMRTIEQTSSIFSTTTAAASVNFLQIKNMIELTVENARLREKQLENDIVDLRNEITKEQDCKQKLEEEFLQLQRIRNILIKKLKRINRSNVCSRSNTNLFDQVSSKPIPVESLS